MAEWLDIASEIRAQVPGCPDLTLRNHLRQTARAFCRDTHVWTAPLDPLFPFNGSDNFTPTYDLEPPEDAEILSVARVVQRDRPIDHLVTLMPEPVIELYEAEVGKPVVVTVVLQPTYTSATFPDQLLFDYQEALKGGTLARLMMMPGVDWSNPQFGALHQQAYNTGVREARVRRSRGNTEAGQRVRFPGFI